MGTFAYYLVLTLLITIAVLLILLILIQKGRGGGLSGAFGGGGGGSSAFGAKTGDVLTWATSIGFGIFIALAVILDLVVDNQYKSPLASVPAAPVAPISTSSEPSPSMPTNQPALPPATQPLVPVSSTATSVQQNIAASSQAAPSALDQMIQHATTQATGAISRTTQPVGKLLNGIK